MDFLQEITDTAVSYEKLNASWVNDPCETSPHQVNSQEEYRDTYKQLQAFDLETIIHKIIADSVHVNVLTRLYGLIQENIRIYETRQDDFNSIEFNRLGRLRLDYPFTDKYEVSQFDKQFIEDYPYPTEQDRELLLKENHRDKIALDNERDDLRRANASWIGKNYYSLIHGLSCRFLAVFDSYFPPEKEKEHKEIRPAVKPGAYFDMYLVSRIHRICNNIQFENMTELDLYAILNLQPANVGIVIKPDERMRVYYLVHKLYEYLKTDDRTQWRSRILKTFGITEKSYKSKYKEPASDVPGRKSEEFVSEIDEIFK